MVLPNSSHAICDVLAEKVRVLTLKQISNTWFFDAKSPLGSAKRCIRKLTRSGAVITTQEMLHPEIDVSTPLLDWVPGSDDVPDLGRLSWKAKSRFKAPAVRTLVVKGPDVKNFSATSMMHDVLLSQVFLNHFCSDPTAFSLWTPENNIRPEDCTQYGGRIPDAVLTEDGREVLIECIAAYSKRRLVETFDAWKSLSFRFY